MNFIKKYFGKNPEKRRQVITGFELYTAPGIDEVLWHYKEVPVDKKPKDRFNKKLSKI